VSVQTHPFGHPKARKFIKGDHIPHQKIVIKGDTLEQAAMVCLISEAFQGRGTLSKPLKEAAKALVEKFEKSNPDFKFSKFSRDRNKTPEPVAPKSSKSKPEKTKPSKTDKKSDSKSSPSKKPSKAPKKGSKEPALAGA
jgi:hypothetical protein